MTKAIIIYGDKDNTTHLKGALDRIEWFLSVEEIQFQIIYMNDLPVEDLLQMNTRSKWIQAANYLVELADIVIMLTPVYQASYPGILKTYLDLLPHKALKDKCILPVAMGLSMAQLTMFDAGFRTVLQALGANNVMRTAFIEENHVERVDKEQYALHPIVEKRISHILEKLLLITCVS